MAKLNRENIAMYVLTCSTYDEAAEKTGVSKSTLYRLRKESEFQEVINQLKNRMFQDTMQKAQGYCMESLEVLRTVMSNPSATDSSRVSAARTILEMGIALHEDENIIQRLKSLESRFVDD